VADAVGNGLEVLEALERQKYGLVFLDVQMPEMDGLTAAGRIVERWTFNERPKLIAMTANAMAGDRERCIEAGMDDYISKPVRVEEVQNIIQQWGFGILKNRKTFIPAESDSLIDTDKIDSLIRVGKDDQEFMKELIAMYMDQAPYYIAQMNELIKTKEIKRLEEIAHTLKGTSANLGAVKVTRICEQIEKFAQRGDIIKIEQNLADVISVYQKTTVAMKSYLDRLAKK
jgi:CheY-like chemotaxis protein/HPt (histidine-containing phosphotransfer) domain-containing protein